jgi:spore germination protein GerM
VTRRRTLQIAGGALVVVVVAWAFMIGLGRFLRTPTGEVVPDAPPAESAPAQVDPAVPRIQATLYFASEDGLKLVPTEREVPLADGVVAQARAIIEAQLSAPAPPPLTSTIPPGTTLRGLYVSQSNEAFVDLDASIRTAHPGGTLEELLTVYTLTNALLTNLPTLKEVQLLIDGREADTLAGHVDLRRPLKKNDSLIATPTPP